MRKFLRWAFKKLKFSTWYHVSAVFHKDSHVGESVISMTVHVTPWIHTENFSDVVDFVKSRADGAKDRPCITSITRLGP